MKKIVLDLDGVVAEGRHIVVPENPLEAYMALMPYDADTVQAYNALAEQHHLTILTARHEPDALHQIAVWLHLHGMRQPLSIITHVPPREKGRVVRALRADHFVDDSAEAFVCALAEGVPDVWLMHNEGWAANVNLDAGRRRVRSWRELQERLV